MAISEEEVDVLDPEASVYDPSVASPGVRTLKSVWPGSYGGDDESSSRDDEGEEGKEGDEELSKELSDKKSGCGRHRQDASAALRPGAT